MSIISSLVGDQFVLRQRRFNRRTKRIRRIIKPNHSMKFGKRCLLLLSIFLPVITLTVGIQAPNNGLAYAQTEGEIEDNLDNKPKNFDKNVNPFTSTQNTINSISSSEVSASASSSSNVHGDFNGDGRADLAIGVPGEDVDETLT